jgi:DNA-binding transcriptional ArsR family regulator
LERSVRPAQVFSEFVATFGRLAVIWGCACLRPSAVPFAVASYITAAYWFTASTSFANPTVTLARSAIDTFAGIRPADAPAFIVAQLLGATAATALFRWLVPTLPDVASTVVVPRSTATPSTRAALPEPTPPRRCPTAREGHLTKLRQFHRLRNMKTITRLPLTQLSADETHVEAFKALAHLSRLQVFFLLVKAGREMSVGEIQEAVEIPGPTLSHHLDILRRAGLVESRKEERYIYYSVQRERVTALVRLLTACC